MTPINRLLKKSKKEITSNQTPETVQEEDILIDVEKNDIGKVSNKKSNNQHTELNENNENLIEMCSGSKYIKEKLEMVNNIYFLTFNTGTKIIRN